MRPYWDEDDGYDDDPIMEEDYLNDNEDDEDDYSYTYDGDYWD